MADGVQIQFDATTGHTVDDKWCISAKSQFGGTMAQNLGDLGRSAFAMFEGPPNDFIPAGSEVKFSILESGQIKTRLEVKYDATEITRNYSNLEELIVGVDPNLSKWQFYQNNDHFFRRGIMSQTDNGGKSQIKILGNSANDQSITSPSLTDGSKISLIIPSLGRQGGLELAGRSFIRSASISVNYPDEYEYNAEAMNPSDDYF